MAVSRVGGCNLTLPERRSLSTSPWDLYKTVLETAKNEPSKIVNWIAIEEMLRPYAIKIIELLKTFTPSAF
jgi:hypothetical protein